MKATAAETLVNSSSVNSSSVNSSSVNSSSVNSSSVNSSSVFNSSLPYPGVSSRFSSLSFYLCCLRSKPTSILYTMFTITLMILVLPLCIFILHHGLQQWKQKRSTSSAATISHSDCFTFHAVTIELIGGVGFLLCLTGIYTDNTGILSIGLHFIFFIWYGGMFFHILTCVERYLAVVHPITYLSLRTESGIRFRNIVSFSAWLLCLAAVSLTVVEDADAVLSFCLLIFSLTAVCFCSLSVLFALIRPGPGDQDTSRVRVDPSKQRAFHTVLAISTVLFVRFMWGVVWLSVYLRREGMSCITAVFDFWFVTPSSLVLPLLYLHRAGKLACCSSPCFVRR